MKLKHLYMLGVVALMTASCNEDRFLDLKPQVVHFAARFVT